MVASMFCDPTPLDIDKIEATTLEQPAKHTRRDTGHHSRHADACGRGFVCPRLDSEPAATMELREMARITGIVGVPVTTGACSRLQPTPTNELAGVARRVQGRLPADHKGRNVGRSASTTPHRGEGNIRAAQSKAPQSIGLESKPVHFSEPFLSRERAFEVVRLFYIYTGTGSLI